MNEILDGFLVLFAVACGIGVIVFWVKMLIRAARLPSPSDKIVWVLIILFLGIFGAIIFALAGPKPSAEGLGGLTHEDRKLLQQMQAEFENGPGSRRKVVLTPEEERMVAEYRRAYQGESL